jgi:hypothetical protein
MTPSRNLRDAIEEGQRGGEGERGREGEGVRERENEMGFSYLNRENPLEK